MTFAVYALALLVLAGACAYAFDDLFAELATSRGGEPQAAHVGLDALRWVDASSPPLAAVSPRDGHGSKAAAE